MEVYSTALQGGPGADSVRAHTTSKPMSDIPPAPARSPIVIIGLLALAGAVLAAIGYIWAHL